MIKAAKTIKKSKGNGKSLLQKRPPAKTPSVKRSIIADAIAKAAESQKKAWVDNQDLPSTYNTTRLTILARDPHWMHAYWEIASSDIERAKNELGNDFAYSAYVIRVYDVTLIDFDGRNANHWFDVDIGPDARRWYINLWNNNVTYCAELGIRSPHGRFIALARSNSIYLPRASISQRQDMIWMEVKGDEPQAPYINMLPALKRGRKKTYGRTPGTHIRKPGRMTHLTENDIRAYYASLFPLLSRIKFQKRRNGRGGQRSLRDIFGYRVPKGMKLEGLLQHGMSWEEFYQKILLGSSAEMVLRKQAGASEQLHISSGASEREEKERKFFFEIGTELIVYGRTEPDAEVKLGNQTIPLREDGTFTLRFALPDGKIPLDFAATSSDKVEQRRITTSVERTKTMYSP